MSRLAPRDKSLDQLPAAFARYVEAEPTRSPSDPRDVMTNLAALSDGARRLGCDPEKALRPTARARAIVQVAILVGLLFGVAACKEAYVGPPFASNGTDQAGIVRFVGTSGQVDFSIPPQTSLVAVPAVPLDLGNGLTLQQYDQENYGFLRLEVSATQIVGTYVSAPYPGSAAQAAVREQFAVDLAAHTVRTLP